MAVTTNTALRLERIRPWVDGKKVLDIGAGHGTFHGRIREVAASAVGLERDTDLVAAAQRRGLDVRQGDAQEFDLGESFEVVVAGELIEHISCPGRFLGAVRNHLEPGGRLVLTTPNAFAVTNFLRRIAAEGDVNAEHVAWYCPRTLRTLVVRHGFRLVHMEFLPHRSPGALRSVVARAIRAPLPDRLAHNTILFVAEIESDTTVVG